MVWRRFVQYVSSSFAFFPPQPPTYSFIEGKHNSYQFSDNDPDFSGANVELMFLDTDRKERIAAMYYKVRGATTTVLFSHGNAVDMGIMRYFFMDLAKELQVNVLGYDYSGYGASSGQPTVDNTLSDVRACWDCLTKKYGVKPKDIILYGQSVGSGPSTDLAAKHGVAGLEIGGLVLHSPLLSGVRVLYPGAKRWPKWADVFPNHELISKVRCPVLVMHGTEDEVIDISHGYTLHERSSQPFEPLWAEGYDHQDLEHCPQYFPHLQKFVSHCARTAG